MEGANRTSVIIGGNLFVPVRNRTYDAGSYLYAAFSRTIGKTRLTVGGFHFSPNVVAVNAQRGGGQFGVEHPLSSKFTLATDWYTGRHTSGYFTPGVIFKPHSRVTGYAGYSIGNMAAGQGNHFFLLEVGYNFN